MTEFQFLLNVTQKGRLGRTVTGQSWWVEDDVNKELTGLWFMESQLFGQIDLPKPDGKVHFRVYRDPDFAANTPGVDYWGDFRQEDERGFIWGGSYGRAVVAQAESGGAVLDRSGLELVLGEWKAEAVVISPIFARQNQDERQLETLKKAMARA
jgi:hypothetical protein